MFVEPGRLDMIMRLRGRGISDVNVLRAMELIPRSAFVEDDCVPDAYEEKPLPIPCGQSLPPPMTIAILCQTLEATHTDKVLLIGAGSGYAACILGQICTRVYAVERYKTLVDLVESRRKKYANNVVVRHGDGRLGWRGQAPFDKILLCGSVRMLPTAMLTQLKPKGRIVGVIDGHLSVGARKSGVFKETPIMPMDLPPLEPGKSKIY